MILECPCGGTNVHAEKEVQTWDNREPEGRWSHRIPFWCENGCRFSLVIEQYKGETFIVTEGYREGMEN